VVGDRHVVARPDPRHGNLALVGCVTVPVRVSVPRRCGAECSESQIEPSCVAPASVVVCEISSIPQRRVMPCAVAGFVVLASRRLAEVSSALAPVGPTVFFWPVASW
jgi:hypothetical protein